MTALEDKIVQRATVTVLNAIYETDFLGFSYGFRPGRNAHNALDAIYVGVRGKQVNWVLDVDIRGYFDTINHEWLIKFIEHRVKDKRVIRHVEKWLKAGVLEEGKRTQTEEGTPQGGNISPLLANVYLHYVFDLWANHWRKTRAHGDVIIVRYADDFVVGFQHQSEAVQFLKELQERFREFNLELNAEKTRLIEFGRHAARNRKAGGKGKPETFDFLGFTHVCGRTRKGGFAMVRHTTQKRQQAKLRELKAEMRRRLHAPVPETGKWLRSVLLGYYRYYAVPGNLRKLSAFQYHIYQMWYRALRRRSQTHCLSWSRMNRLRDRWLPTPRTLHPYPFRRLCVTT